ncbi:hypothetical protein MRB53_014594 [Persea americana]|uniref:Uncharacterized protein n=1 Tax=Persea americana TaxID=3435 RepID=A0ACC2KBI4_PERAE|nr:hypothetical protein MRB53_014594 [Persea americana]
MQNLHPEPIFYHPSPPSRSSPSPSQTHHIWPLIHIPAQIPGLPDPPPIFIFPITQAQSSHPSSPFHLPPNLSLHPSLDLHLSPLNLPGYPSPSLSPFPLQTTITIFPPSHLPLATTHLRLHHHHVHT